jgi:hypothetical protein
VTKKKEISCPFYLISTEKVNFLSANKEKNSQETNKTADFFVVFHFDQITNTELMRYIQH